MARRGGLWMMRCGALRDSSEIVSQSGVGKWLPGVTGLWVRWQRHRWSGETAAVFESEHRTRRQWTHLIASTSLRAERLCSISLPTVWTS